VAGVELTGTLKVGDAIHIKGATTDMQLVVESMQLNNQNITEAQSGQSVGIKVAGRVRRGDRVYKVVL
jgi:selenocysteine-specific translation elongation factor